MSSDGENQKPFRMLGRQLKRLRERVHESLAEVSGAVEIDVKELAGFELGRLCPSEEILLLLISHFGAKDDEATKLWELAGYAADKIPTMQMVSGLDGQPTQSVMVMPADARIVYTDFVHVMVNNYGVVMNFMQGAGPNMQPLAVSRIGMSKEHAKSVLQVLQATLEQAEQPAQKKQISSPDSSS